jgi:hypothetical protein
MINHIGKNFNSLLGSEMVELKFKLSGYKYFLSDFVGELQRKSKFYEMDFENKKHDAIVKESARVITEKGKVS